MSIAFESSIRKRLIESEQNLGESQSTLEKLLSWDAEYEALNKFLTSVTEKTHLNTHVRLGKLAFAEGDLIHTNEVMVSLGDNWFVDRSASQAKGVVKRRRDCLQKEIEGVQAQIKNLKAKSSLYAEAGVKSGWEEDAGFVEIREEVGVNDTNFSAIVKPTRSNPVAPKELGDFERKMMKKLRKYELEEEEGAGDIEEDERDDGEELDEYGEGLREFGSEHKEDDDEDDCNASESLASDGDSTSDDQEDAKLKPRPLRPPIWNLTPLRPAIRSPADIYERMRGLSVKDGGKAVIERERDRDGPGKPSHPNGRIMRDVVERDVKEADASDLHDYTLGKEIAEEYVNARNKLVLRDLALPKGSSDEDSDDDNRAFRHLRSGAASRTMKMGAEAIVNEKVQVPLEKLVEKPAEKKTSLFKERRLQK